MNRLTPATASAWARLALRCIEQEYPNKPEHVLNGAGDLRGPKALHPAFYGCYDWHSAVHGHWMLIQLLSFFPELPDAPQIRAVLGRHFTADSIQAEVRYLNQPGRNSFERTYGWAWLLKLAEALHTWNSADGQRWEEHLQPLTSIIIKRYQDFLPRQAYPIRTGVHPNAAFGLAFALDYARAAGVREFEQVLIQSARAYFEKDQDYPAEWEPGGEDFFSPALIEADLMRRVLGPDFATWFGGFLPKLTKESRLLKPAEVSDRSDPKLVHLDGLNLSRAWCMGAIARALPQANPHRQLLLASAKAHLRATLPELASGHYEGEHWLATFAVYSVLEQGN